MQSSEIDWKSGQVTFWDLDCVDAARPVAEQLDSLKEDLAQVCYGGGIVLDIGYYPWHATRGQFRVYVVHNEHWDEPFFDQRCRTISALVDLLPAAVEVAEARAATARPR